MQMSDVCLSVSNVVFLAFWTERNKKQNPRQCVWSHTFLVMENLFLEGSPLCRDYQAVSRLRWKIRRAESSTTILGGSTLNLTTSNEHDYTLSRIQTHPFRPSVTVGRTLSKVEGTPALGGAAAHQRASEHELTQAGQLYQQIKAHYTINELLCFRGLLYPVILHWKLSFPILLFTPSFIFSVPGDFGWMINSLNEIAQSEQKATTRYPTEQKTSTNTATLTDWIEMALRNKKKHGKSVAVHQSLILTHT